MTYHIDFPQHVYTDFRLYIKNNFVGENNRVTKEELAVKFFGAHTPDTDRKVRYIISKLQTDGALIITDVSEGAYFWIGNNPDTAIRYLQGEYSRANKITTKANALYNSLAHEFGQAIANKAKSTDTQPGLGF